MLSGLLASLALTLLTATSVLAAAPGAGPVPADDSALITADQAQVLIYAVILAAAFGGLASIKAALDIVAHFRGNPPPDARFASKVDLELARGEIRAVEQRSIAANRENQKALGEIFAELRSINRAIGHLEGGKEG